MNLSCQKCKAPLDPGATGRVTCASCGHVSFVPPRPAAPRPLAAPTAPRPLAAPLRPPQPLSGAPFNLKGPSETLADPPPHAPAASAPLANVTGDTKVPSETLANAPPPSPEAFATLADATFKTNEASATLAEGPATSAAALDVLEDPFALRDPFAEAPQVSPGAATTSDAAATLVRPAPAPAPEPVEPPRAPATSLGTVVPEIPEDDIDEDALLGRRKKGSLHPAALALIAAGAVFGGVAAFLLLRPAPQAPQIVYVTASASAAPTSPPSAGPTTEATAPVGDPTEAPKAGTSARPLGGAWPQTAKTGTPAAAIDMSGFQGPNVAGPTAGTTGGPQTAGAGQLSAGEISAVVEANRPLVKRRCWQPALDATKGMGGSSARVSATIVIAPSGAVQSVSASGAEKDYPGLSSCIASRIKGWKFPASGGSTPVNIPFVFAAQ